LLFLPFFFLFFFSSLPPYFLPTEPFTDSVGKRLFPFFFFSFLIRLAERSEVEEVGVGGTWCCHSFFPVLFLFFFFSFPFPFFFFFFPVRKGKQMLVNDVDVDDEDIIEAVEAPLCGFRSSFVFSFLFFSFPPPPFFPPFLLPPPLSLAQRLQEDTHRQRTRRKENRIKFEKGPL